MAFLAASASSFAIAQMTQIQPAPGVTPITSTVTPPAASPALQIPVTAPGLPPTKAQIKAEKEAKALALEQEKQAKTLALKQQKEAKELALKTEKEAKELALKKEKDAKELALKQDKDAKELVRQEKEAAKEIKKVNPTGQKTSDSGGVVSPVTPASPTGNVTPTSPVVKKGGC